MKVASYIILFILLSIGSAAQNSKINDWVHALRDESNHQFIRHYELYRQLEKLDTNSRRQTALAIDQECLKGNERLQLLGRSVKAKIFFYSTKPFDSLYANQMKRCLTQAIETDEPYLQAEFGRWYSEMLNSLNQKELALQYAITSLKLHELLGYENFRAVSIFHLWVGETLLVTDYVPEAIHYLQKGLDLARTDTLVRPFRFMFTYNNLGLAYRELNRHDSALYWFEKLKAYCVEIDRPVWEKIAYKNRLPCYIELGMLDSAKAVDDQLFEIAKTSRDPDDETIAWEMKGRIAMKEDRPQQALADFLKSLQANAGRFPRLEHRVNESLAACYEAMGQPAAAYPFIKAVSRYNDSVAEAKASYNSRFLAIQANYESEQMRFRQLAAETKNAIRTRNIGILLLALLFLMGAWWLNKRRRKAQQLRQKAGEQAAVLEAEMVNKNEQISQLQTTLHEKEETKEQLANLEALSRFSILTEDDWQQFKQLFEKTYPFFFNSLKQQAPGITEAEQRMAALVRLQLNTKQIAAMQGIGTDSVHKTRHRLRQRFHIQSTAELEEIILGM